MKQETLENIVNITKVILKDYLASLGDLESLRQRIYGSVYAIASEEKLYKDEVDMALSVGIADAMISLVMKEKE